MSGAAPAQVVVVGDVVLDRDVEGRCERLSPEAPVPVLDVTSVRDRPGGAGLTALLCAGTAAGSTVTLLAPIADDEAGRAIRAGLTGRVELVPMGHRGPTRRKIRVRSGGQTLVRIDDGGPGDPIDVAAGTVRERLAQADVVVVSDYGGGVSTHAGLRELLHEAGATRPLVWDPHPRGGPPVSSAALVTPNVAEARGRVGPGGGPPGGSARAAVDEPVELLAERVRRSWAVRAVCLTAGEHGAVLASGNGAALSVPAPRVRALDSCGAGDRFVAAVATELVGGAGLPEAVQAAVLAASAWVGAGGLAAGPGISERAGRSAPASPPDPNLAMLAARLRAGGATLVATGGCFDLVHAGHVATLAAARRLGDALVVLLNSDASVRRLKGPGRPLVTAADRARVLAAFDCVDAVVVFDEDDPRAALEALRPDVWVKGGDYGGAPLPEADVVRRHGGRVVVLPYLDGHSTTALIQRLEVASP